MTIQYDPIIVAHRGVHVRHPENSLEALEEARLLDLKWVECDVWPSADGVAVVIHDETLDRMTTGKGVVWWQRWDELQCLRLIRPDGTVDESSRLPALAELAAMWLPERRLLVEIKPPDSPPFVREVIRTLKQHGGLRGWIIQSFDEANLVHALAADPEVPTAFLVEDRAALASGISHGWKNIHLRHDLLDRPTADELHKLGIQVGVWTPTRKDDLKRVVELRPDMIITDDPVRAALLSKSASDQ